MVNGSFLTQLQLLPAQLSRLGSALASAPLASYLGVGRIVSVMFVERVGDVYFPSGDGV